MLCASGRPDRLLLSPRHGVRRPGQVPRAAVLPRHLFSAPSPPSCPPRPHRGSGRPPGSGRLQGCTPQGGRRRPVLCAGRGGSTVLSSRLLPGRRPTATTVRPERSGAAGRSTAEPSVPGRVCRCGSRGHGSSRSRSRCLRAGFCEAEGRGSFSDVLRPDDGRASSRGSRTSPRAPLSFSLCERGLHAKRQLGFKLDSWR